jgi:uncharacterized protein (DUF2461 family)
MQLETNIADFLTQRDRNISDLLRALWDLLEEKQAELTDPVAQFIRDLVKLIFTSYRDRYIDEDFDWLSALLLSPHTQAQAFLALYALPERWMTIAAQRTIVGSLEKSRFLEEALRQIG